MRLWKDAATLILAVRDVQNVTQSLPKTTNYKLLCLKRHQKSSFMPNNYVFPGGAIDPADCDLKWQKLFQAFGYNENHFSLLYPKTISRPEIFKPVDNQLKREISLRITAIRETFEECGVLICKKLGTENSLLGWAQHLPISVEEIHEWQSKVHNNATEFYKLCERLQCCPDLWSLYEWSNWLTPTFIAGKRFNTAFFLACLPSMPYANYEPTEMEDIQWDTSEIFLSKKYMTQFGPPQQYEFTRISKFQAIEDLLDAAVAKTKLGVQLMFPIRAQLSDGTVDLLPGDSMYPTDACPYKHTIVDQTNVTINEFREMSPIRNRYESKTDSNERILLQCLRDS